MNWDPALWPVIRTAIIALLAFIVVTILAWPATKAAWGDLKKRRAKPAPQTPPRPTRMPPIPRPQCVQAYEMVFNLLRFVSMQKDAFERAIAAHGDEDSSSRRRLVRRRDETIDTFAGLRDATVMFMTRLKEEEVTAIADFMSQSPEYCDGLVTPAECAEFLRSERDLISSQPFTVMGHLDRLNHGGPGKLAEERRQAAEAAVPPADAPPSGRD